MRLFHKAIKHGYAYGEIYIEPRDIWIGLYWKRYPKAITLYICLLPCVPLNIYIQWYGGK